MSGGAPFDPFWSNPRLAAMAREYGVGDELPSGRNARCLPSGYGLQASLPPATVFAVAPPQQVKRTKILEVNAPAELISRGLATIHIHVRDKSTRVVERMNQRIVCTVEWQTGDAGGSAQIDATRGQRFSMVAAQVVRVYANLEANAVDGAGALVALQPGQDKEFEACVQWGGGNYQPAYMSTPLTPLTHDAEGPVLDIPAHARRCMAFSDTTASVVTVKMKDPTARLLYSSDFARTTAGANGTPDQLGAEKFTLTSTVDCNAFALWELWL